MMLGFGTPFTILVQHLISYHFRTLPAVRTRFDHREPPFNRALPMVTNVYTVEYGSILALRWRTVAHGGGGWPLNGGGNSAYRRCKNTATFPVIKILLTLLT